MGQRRFEVLTHIAVNADDEVSARRIVDSILEAQNAAADDADMSFETDGIIETTEET